METIMGHIDLQCCVTDAWKGFIDNLGKSIQMLDEKLTEAENMSSLGRRQRIESGNLFNGLVR